MFGLSTLHLVIGALALVIALGTLFTGSLYVMKGLLWLFMLTSRGLSWLYARLTGREPTSYGSQHWAREPEITAKDLFTPGTVALGTWQGKTLFEQSGANIVCIAPPRAWKSQSLLAPAVNNYQGSVFVNDPRGQLWDWCHVAREAQGPCYRFSPSQKGWHALNVCDLVRWGEDEMFGDVARLAHGILSPDVGQGWDDFRLQAAGLLPAILIHGHDLNQGSLPGVYQWLTNAATSMKAQADDLSKSANPLVRAGGRRLKDVLTSERTASIIWNHLVSALQLYADPLVAMNTDHSDLDLRQLQHGSRPMSVFLCPPFADAPRLRALLGTLTTMLAALCSAQQEAPRQRLLLAMDEMGNLGRLEDFARAQSYLQGCGCQTLQIWQNVAQVREVYEDLPILASCGVTLYYTPGDQQTAAAMSADLGTTTQRLRPETQHVSFWGLLNSTSYGTSEHERPLLTADECRRLPDTAAVILVKGLPPILATKLGVPAPEVIDLAKPWVQKVALATAASLLVGVVSTWALWPTATPAPTLSLTSARTSAPGELGGTGAAVPAPGMTSDLSTPAPPTSDAPVTFGWLDRKTLPSARNRWQLMHTTTPGLTGPTPDTRPELWTGSPFATEDQCQDALAAKIAVFHDAIAKQPPGRLFMSRLPNGYSQTLGTRVKTETWRCVRDDSDPAVVGCARPCLGSC